MRVAGKANIFNVVLLATWFTRGTTPFTICNPARTGDRREY